MEYQFIQNSLYAASGNSTNIRKFSQRLTVINNYIPYKHLSNSFISHMFCSFMFKAIQTKTQRKISLNLFIIFYKSISWFITQKNLDIFIFQIYITWMNIKLNTIPSRSCSQIENNYVWESANKQLLQNFNHESFQLSCVQSFQSC